MVCTDLLDVAEVDVVEAVLDLVDHVHHGGGSGDQAPVQAHHEAVRAQCVDDHRVVRLLK